MHGGLSQSVLKQIEKARKRLQDIGHPGVPLMKKIGAIIAKECRKAFPAQGLDEMKWPARYEGMEDPFINIAGALEDWNAGRKNPQLNRFQDRPALVGPGGGQLGRSITFKLGQSTDGDAQVIVGTAQTYAAVHQEGGFTEIPITDTAKQKIFAWLFRTTKKFRIRPNKKKTGHYGRHGVATIKEKTENFSYSKHVEQLLYMETWRQRISRRPFIGVTETSEREVRNVIQDHFKGIANS